MSDCHARDPGLILGWDKRCLAFIHRSVTFGAQRKITHPMARSTSTSLHYAVILDNSLVVRKKETKEKIEKIEVLDQTHKMTC